MHGVKFPFIVFIICIYFTVSFFHVHAASMPIRIGIMSDSSTDEYRADNNRAGSTVYAATTLNWLELLVRYRNFDAGVWGTRPSPRRTGYAYNWALSGAVAQSLIADGQHTGLAGQIAGGGFSLVYFQIGNNDVAYYNNLDGIKIYNGQLSASQINTKISVFRENIRLALDTILASDPQILVLLGNIGDPSSAPHYQLQFPDPIRRNEVSKVVASMNTEINSLIATRPRVRLFDQQQFALAIFNRVDAAGNIKIANESISLVMTGDEPHHAILADTIHGGTVFEGIFANEVLFHINQMLHTTIAPFNDSELLTNAGIYSSVTSTPTIVERRGDFDNNGVVQLNDLLILLDAFRTGNTAVDVSNNGVVDIFDYSLFVTLYGTRY